MEPVTMDEFTKEFTAILKDFMRDSETSGEKCEFFIRTAAGDSKLYELSDFVFETCIRGFAQLALQKITKNSDISKEALN